LPFKYVYKTEKQPAKGQSKDRKKNLAGGNARLLIIALLFTTQAHGLGLGLADRDQGPGFAIQGLGLGFTPELETEALL